MGGRAEAAPGPEVSLQAGARPRDGSQEFQKLPGTLRQTEAAVGLQKYRVYPARGGKIVKRPQTHVNEQIQIGPLKVESLHRREIQDSHDWQPNRRQKQQRFQHTQPNQPQPHGQPFALQHTEPLHFERVHEASAKCSTQKRR